MSKDWSSSKPVAIVIDFREEEMEVPVISVIGEGDNAGLVTKMALRYGVPVVCNSVLAEDLSTLPEDSEVPPRFYDDIARVFLSIPPKR